jgi:hypothetical protein
LVFPPSFEERRARRAPAADSLPAWQRSKADQKIQRLIGTSFKYRPGSSCEVRYRLLILKRDAFRASTAVPSV